MCGVKAGGVVNLIIIYCERRENNYGTVISVIAIFCKCSEILHNGFYNKLVR
jgi:hypothetical protein